MKKTLLALALAGVLAGCQQTPQTENTAGENAVATQNQAALELDRLLDDYFENALPFHPLGATYLGRPGYNDKFAPPISAEQRAKVHAYAKDIQTRLHAIDKSRLSGQSLLSYEILDRDLTLEFDAERFPGWMMPINQMDGEHNVFAALGSGESAQPFNTVEDYDNFIKRADGFIVWLASAQDAMRQGIAAKVVLPRPLAQKLVPQFSAHVVAKAEDSLFWGPVKNLPAEFSEAEKAAITAKYREMIEQRLVPAYRDMETFLKETYIPNCRDTVGYGDLPDGKAWYQLEIKRHTTLDKSADEIHELGKQEVARILSEMTKVKETVGFNGDLQAFFNHLRDSDEFYYDTPEELVAAYEAVKKKIDARLPQLFDIQPKADYIVKPVEAYRAESAAGASYEAPAPDGSRPGIFYINTHNLKAQPKFLLETLSIHEAAPGHHFQIALQQEVQGLPTFRKFGGYTVFAEGWALYAESLGKEMGLFSDPYMWYGRLSDEQLRAMRLVLDTGFHAKGWTRQQGIDYMLANSSMAESDVIAEVERYIAWPGQATSYKLGQFKIRELRNYCEKALGDRFDIRAFHRQILIDGSLPMPILEQKIKRWVKSQQA